MTPSRHAELVGQVARQVAVLQAATDELDAAAAERLEVNRTDLRCISLLYFHGPATAKDLTAATRLTRGAFTTVLDRLERAGYTRRVPDSKDRRRVNVELTPAAQEIIQEMWGPVGDEGVRSLSEYSGDELTVILDFLHRSIDLQIRHTARIRATVTARRLTGTGGR